MAFSACEYEDGPVLSLRSKGARMTFYRPLTYYENNGIDSTDALNQRFEDSIPSFQGKFQFVHEPGEDYFFVKPNDSRDVEAVGMWFYDTDAFEQISVYIKGQTWPDRWWTITRLTHRKLWLEGPGGRLLRFEK